MTEKTSKYSSLQAREKMLQLATALVEKKAEDTVIIDLSGIESFADGIIMASATSLRHAKGLADQIMQLCKHEKLEFLHVEGYQGGQWILLDLNDVIVNIFQTSVRELYNLEGLWSELPRLDLPEK